MPRNTAPRLSLPLPAPQLLAGVLLAGAAVAALMPFDTLHKQYAPLSQVEGGVLAGMLAGRETQAACPPLPPAQRGVGGVSMACGAR